MRIFLKGDRTHLIYFMTLWFLFFLGNFNFEPHVFCECDLILSSPENFSFQVPRSEPAVISFNFELDRNRMRPLI